MLVLLAALGLASCSTAPKPIPVFSAPSDASKLAGTWEGEFSSQETKHHGSIRFELSANSDSAYGDVTMVDDGSRHQIGPRETNATGSETTVQTLSIGFVIAQGDSVYGAMQPYADHDGTTLLTRFSGRWRGDEIEGLYFTQNTRTSALMTGEWSVKRKKP
jgi:hypothetical protein